MLFSDLFVWAIMGGYTLGQVLGGVWCAWRLFGLLGEDEGQ